MRSPLALLPVALLSALVLLSSAAPPPPYAHLVRTLRTVDPTTLLAPLSSDISRISAPTDVHDIIAGSSPLPRPTIENYTLDFCREQGHCNGIRRCIWVNSTQYGACETFAASNEVCFCFPLPPPAFLVCNEEPVCDDNEFCSHPKGVEDRLCISNTYLSHPESFPPVQAAESGDDPKPAPTSAAKGEDQNEEEEGEGEVDEDGEDDEKKKKKEAEEKDECVDARALAHLGAGELVYGTHVKARVLCDATGSCATPGHVVVFKGEAMMMRRYCEKVGCENDVIDVNSPTYRKALRVASRTGGLEYTTFAARYESSIEESVIRLAVRAGL